MVYRKHPRPTDAQLLDGYYALYCHLNHWPGYTELQEDKIFTHSCANAHYMRFGSHKGLIAATKIAHGLLSERERMEIELHRPEILHQLQARYGHISYWLPQSTYAKDLHIPSCDMLARYCGGLDAALRELGLPVCFPSREDLIVALQKAADILGRTPRLADADAKLCIYPYSAYLNEFGTWNQAILAAGLSPSLEQPNRWKPYEQQPRSLYRHRNQTCADFVPSATATTNIARSL